MHGFRQVNERVQELESGNSTKIGNDHAPLTELTDRCTRYFVAELQKALTFAEEQMENAKVSAS